MVPLAEAIGDHPRVDLLHVDIQGGEADLSPTRSTSSRSASATWSSAPTREPSKGACSRRCSRAGWKLEIERPAIFAVLDGEPSTTIDGVQGWRNPRLRP